MPTDQPVCFVSREDWVDLANHHLNESRLSKELDSSEDSSTSSSAVACLLELAAAVAGAVAVVARAGTVSTVAAASMTTSLPRRVATASPALRSPRPETSDDRLPAWRQQLTQGRSEGLQRAGDAARHTPVGNITPHHIRQAVRSDRDLRQLVGASALEQGGMLRPAKSAETAAGEG